MPTSSRPLVDPQLLSLLDSVPPLELSVDILPVIRSMPSSFPTEPVARPDDVEVGKGSFPGPAGAPETSSLESADDEPKDLLQHLRVCDIVCQTLRGQIAHGSTR